MPPAQQKDDQALLATALDHTWRWYELRQGQSVQVVNFFLLAAAVMSAGYVSALNDRLYVAAGGLGLLGTLASGIAFFVSRRFWRIGRLAEDPMAVIEDRLASDLRIDSLRMLEAHHPSRMPGWGATHLTTVGTGASALIGLAAAFYAWLGH